MSEWRDERLDVEWLREVANKLDYAATRAARNNGWNRKNSRLGQAADLLWDVINAKP